MKTNGFSLIEILVVTVIVSILISFGFNTYTNSRIKTQTKIEQHYLLQIPTLIENHFFETLKYPDTLNEVLVEQNGHIRTPMNYYFLDYALNQDNSYKVLATLNENVEHSALIKCHRLIVKSSGELLAFSSDNTDITIKCWN